MGKNKRYFFFDTYDSETATPENDPLYQYRGDISDGKFVITVKAIVSQKQQKIQWIHKILLAQQAQWGLD